MKEADYHQEIRQLEGAQKESRDREMGLKASLEEAACFLTVKPQR